METDLSEQVKARLERSVFSPELPIREAIPALERAGVGILLLCSPQRQLVGTVTDGDIRRAILRNVPFDEPCTSIASHAPVVAHLPLTRTSALHLMDHAKDFIINHLPILDERGQVIGLALRSDFVNEEQPPLSAVIMAGGLGTRLRPLTEDLPKPMLPVGDRPLMELIIEQLRRAGIHQVNITTHYKPEKIIEYFGNGEAFGVNLTYVTEDRPLGTAGGVGLLESSDEPLLVINGDILTRIDFRAMLDFHRAHHADLTIAVRPFEFEMPYGVVEVDGSFVRQVREKPRLNFLTNAGIYLLEPNVQRLIPNGQHLDMTELIELLIANKQTVVSFPIIEYWLDIGQHADYVRAQEDVRRGTFAM